MSSRRFHPYRSLLLGLVLAACDVHAPPRQVDEPRHVAAPGSAASEVASAPASAAAEPAYPPPAPPDPPIALKTGGKDAVSGTAGAVTTVESNATRIGAEVLRKGGNAIDATVAIAYALAVTHPSAGNIGGGGFMVIRLANGETHAIDFRETAPAASTLEKNKQQLDAGAFGYLSAPVPGTVAGMSLALKKYGTRPLDELMKPAIALAKNGHKLGGHQAEVMSWSWEKLKHDAAARKIYSKNGKEPLKEGDLWKQPDLGKTLEAIAKNGPSGFYAGPVADAIDKAMKAHGGLVTREDLAGYEAKEREPLRFSYRGLTVDTMPPPSMGGIAFAEIMLTLERQRANEAALDSGLSLHLFVEAARRAYADRRAVGADPDFMEGDMEQRLIAKLLGGKHLETRQPVIDREKATPSNDLQRETDTGPAESPQTTHFSVVDAAGNAVSCTYTQSASFGSKIVVPGTGILFSNAMGAFSWEGPNALAPKKRMASSMTPAIVSQNGKLAIVLGSPGGDTIPNTVAQVFRNLVDYGMTIDEAIAHGRIHHQWHPDKIRVEKGNPPPKAALDDLVKRGHTIEQDASPIGDANDILYDAATGTSWAFADPRERGKAEGVNAK